MNPVQTKLLFVLAAVVVAVLLYFLGLDALRQISPD